jgi:hypothetical protein
MACSDSNAHATRMGAGASAQPQCQGVCAPQCRHSFPSDNNVLELAHTLGVMNRGDALDVFVETLELLVPIAKAVPALGQTVEGALEAAIRVIKLAQVCNECVLG